MATTFVTVAGGGATTPQETTLPSPVSAILLDDAADTATTFVNPAGTVVWPPHATTVPLLRTARLNPLPAAIATAFNKLEGADAAP